MAGAITRTVTAKPIPVRLTNWGTIPSLKIGQVCEDREEGTHQDHQELFLVDPERDDGPGGEQDERGEEERDGPGGVLQDQVSHPVER